MHNIEVVDLQKSFVSRGKKLKVLDGVSFSVEEGSLVCILGPSGSGKSVTLKVIAGLLDHDSGKVRIGGSDNRDTMGRRLAFVFQDSRLMPWKTVENNIKYVLRSMDKTKQEMDEIVHNILETMDMVDFKKYYPHQISGGMQQRVSLARALAYDSDVILMDEPFASLDEITAIALREEIIQVWERTQKTIVFVTHNIAEACYLATKIVLLTPKPTRVHTEIPIELKRPRLFGGEELFEEAKQVFREFEACLLARRAHKEDFI